MDMNEKKPTRSLFGRASPYPYVSFLILIALVILIRIFAFPGDGETIQSIAVLPLENLSGDPEKEFFCLGMTEALITELSKISALRVISRQSVLQYRGSDKPLPVIAGELAVDAIVEGSALLAGNNARITAQLIQARTDRHIWADSYEGELGDVISLQRQVARAVGREIKVRITPQEEASLLSPSPVDPESYQLYLRGRFFWDKRTPEALARAIDYFQQAISKDEKFLEDKPAPQ